LETRYGKLADSLIKRIKQGFWGIGDYLPSENNLAVEFEVSRPTVRRALQNLEENGFISRRRGDGTRVLAAKPTNSFNYATQPIADLLYGGGAERIVTSKKAIIADEELAHQLDGKPGKHWLKICQHRLDRKSQQMLVWGNVYIDFRYQDIQARIDDYPGFICDLLEEQHGVVINEIQQVIKPILLTNKIAKVMDVEQGSLALEMTRRYLNSRKQHVEISINIFPALRSTHQFTLKRTRQSLGEK
jgi:GntR family transcriptional regulator